MAAPRRTAGQGAYASLLSDKDLHHSSPPLGAAPPRTEGRHVVRMHVPRPPPGSVDCVRSANTRRRITTHPCGAPAADLTASTVRHRDGTEPRSSFQVAKAGGGRASDGVVVYRRGRHGSGRAGRCREPARLRERRRPGDPQRAGSPGTGAFPGRPGLRGGCRRAGRRCLGSGEREGRSGDRALHHLQDSLRHGLQLQAIHRRRGPVAGQTAPTRAERPPRPTTSTTLRPGRGTSRWAT